MFICEWKFENGNIYCLKRKHKLVALTHESVQSLPVYIYRKMYIHFMEDVHLKLKFKFTSLIAHFVIVYRQCSIYLCGEWHINKGVPIQCQHHVGLVNYLCVKYLSVTCLTLLF